MTWSLYRILWLLWPFAWVLLRVKAWAERYSDPTTHRAYVVNNWHKFHANPLERVR